MGRGLGRQEVQMLAYAQMRRKAVVRAGDLTGPLKLTRTQERELFRRMARRRLIARVRPGLYLVPPNLPLGGSWSPDEALALATLMAEVRGRYQLCGPNAFNRYGYDNQVPTRVYAYNNRISGERRVGALSLSLIKVADARLGGTEKVKAADGTEAVFSSRARTLIDAVYDWSRFDSLPRAFEWIRRDLASGSVEPAQLARLALRYGDVGTLRRVGALLEREGVDARLLRRLERALSPTTSLIPWIPTRPKRGTVDRRWAVVWNDRA
jgi:predicted transcriptional regulator of viral defense system